jgi:hypothetical protein
VQWFEKRIDAKLPLEDWIHTMLAASAYTKEFVKTCRTNVALQIATYKRLVAAATSHPVEAAVEALEPVYFGNLLIALDAHFVHRLRGVEGKDGNPLNEVRMLCSSLINNAAVLHADKTIKYAPAKSVLKYEIGQKISLTERDFALLAEAFLAEIERKYL